jgi:hypothetical protein
MPAQPALPFAVLLAALALSTSAAPANAGASNAILECNSRTGSATHVRLHGDIPGDLADFSLTLEVDGKSLAMTPAEDTIDIIIELARGVFTLAVERKDHGDLRMYAVPKSVRLHGGSRRLFDARFDAVLLSAPKPGFDDPMMSDEMLHDVRLACTLHHSVEDRPVREPAVGR